MDKCCFCGNLLESAAEILSIQDTMLRFSGSSNIHLLASSLDMFCAKIINCPHGVSPDEWRLRHQSQERQLLCGVLPPGLGSVVPAGGVLRLRQLVQEPKFLQTKVGCCTECQRVHVRPKSPPSVPLAQEQLYRPLLIPQSAPPSREAAASLFQGTQYLTGLVQGGTINPGALPVIDDGMVFLGAASRRKQQPRHPNRKTARSLANMTHTKLPAVCQNFVRGVEPKQQMKNNVQRIVTDARRYMRQNMRGNCDFSLCVNKRHFRRIGGSFDMNDARVVANKGLISRDPRSKLWESKLRREYVPNPANTLAVNQLCLDSGFLVAEVARVFEVLNDMSRPACPEGLIDERHFQQFLARMGMKLPSIASRMFFVYAESCRHLPWAGPVMRHHDAVRILCCFGVGNVRSQASEAFKLLDQDGSGLVSRAELLQFVISALPAELNPDKMRMFNMLGRMCNCIDREGRGEMSYQQFVGALEKDPEVASIWKAVWPMPLHIPAFDLFDLSLGNILRALCPSVLEQEQRYFMERRVHRICIKLAEEANSRPMTNAELNALFEEIDTDGSGDIDIGELRHYLQEKEVPQSRGFLELIFARADRDGNGSVELNEFRTLQREITNLTKTERDPEVWLPSEVVADMLSAQGLPSTECLALLETPEGVPTQRFVVCFAQMARQDMDRFRRLESATGFIFRD